MAAPMPAAQNANEPSFFYAPLAPLDFAEVEETEAFEPEIILPGALDTTLASSKVCVGPC